MTETIVVPKYRTPKRRLNAVADLLEAHPRLHDQDQWTAVGNEPAQVARAATCGSVGCGAGWGIAFTPSDQIPRFIGWQEGGMTAFGIDVDTADQLFSGNFAGDLQPRARTRRMVKALRYLADLSPAERRDPAQADVIEHISDTGRIPKKLAA